MDGDVFSASGFGRLIPEERTGIHWQESKWFPDALLKREGSFTIEPELHNLPFHNPVTVPTDLLEFLAGNCD
jgi:hypothetical protein